MTAFTFRKQWGAELLDNGANFRIWAPAAEGVWLRDDKGALHKMTCDDAGWFSLHTDAIPVDGGYCFQLADGTRVPDPASRAQISEVHGQSRLVDPRRFEWRYGEWRGRAWEEAVVYELHTGAFSDSGDFEGVRAHLAHLRDLGITAVELMPVAQFAGNRGWGYDGVLLYAPHSAYGGPDALKRLVDEAHGLGLMVLLDVVYNHFGPDGNYLSLYASEFFDRSRMTPWGPAIAFDRPPVRTYFVENALYWLEEFRFDGLRLDAIDQIDDQSEEPILEEIAASIRTQIKNRHIHLTTEDSRNIVSLHPYTANGHPTRYTAEWNDDWHHAAHVLVTGEQDGYYADYKEGPAILLARTLAEGFSYQGEYSTYLKRRRGETSTAQPPGAFIDFLQNHDQTGNRAIGERLTTLADPRRIEAMLSILLLAPHIPLLFMGEEWGETRPFLFFTDFHGELADAVREGRRKEFADWPAFADPDMRTLIPDPNALSTFDASKIDWRKRTSPDGSRRLSFMRNLLHVRQTCITPLLAGSGSGKVAVQDDTNFHIIWPLASRKHLHLHANLSDSMAPAGPPQGSLRLLHTYPETAATAFAEGQLPPWGLVWHHELPGGE